MYADEVRIGLRRLAELATAFEIGALDSTKRGYPLLTGGKILAWVSWEFVMDLPNTPGHETILRKGLDLAWKESKEAKPHVVLISGEGAVLGSQRAKPRTRWRSSSSDRRV